MHALEPRVILAGKRDSRRHSITSFSKNVVVAETSYRMFKVIILQSPSIKITVLTFLEEKSTNDETNIDPVPSATL